MRSLQIQGGGSGKWEIRVCAVQCGCGPSACATTTNPHSRLWHWFRFISKNSKSVFFSLKEKQKIVANLSKSRGANTWSESGWDIRVVGVDLSTGDFWDFATVHENLITIKAIRQTSLHDNASTIDQCKTNCTGQASNSLHSKTSAWETNIVAGVCQTAKEMGSKDNWNCSAKDLQQTTICISYHWPTTFQSRR